MAESTPGLCWCGRKGTSIINDQWYCIDHGVPPPPAASGAEEWPPEKLGHYLCERCGGSGKQQEGSYDIVSKSYTGKAGVCQSCDGEGYLGKIVGYKPTPTLQPGQRVLVEAEIRDVDGADFDGMVNVTINDNLVTVYASSIHPFPQPAIATKCLSTVASLHFLRLPTTARFSIARPVIRWKYDIRKPLHWYRWAGFRL